TAASVGQALASAIEDDPETLVLDLRETTFVDSTGLRAIYAANAGRRRRRQDGLVLVPNDMTQRLFQITGLDETLSVAPDLDSVLFPGGSRRGADEKRADA